MIPLNGTKTHPLKPSALEALRKLASSPMPRQELNPGVANRLERDALVETIMLPSPYKTHKGRDLEHYRLTDAGRATLTDNSN
jgi:hypothetical protein